MALSSEASGQHSCDRCGAPVTEHDLRQGLAVRIAREIVCPICVDALPGDALLKINQLRALRGMDSNTYQVPSREHPEKQFFTFSTTANLLRHRHALKEHGSFKAPPLPDRKRTVSHRHEASQAANQAKLNTQRERLLRFWPMVAAGAIFLVLSIAWMSARQGRGTDSLERSVEVDPLAKAEALRQEFLQHPDPSAAWEQARQTRLFASEDPLFDILAESIRIQKADDLDQAALALEQFALGRAREHLARTPLPIDRRLVSLREQEQRLQQRLHDFENPPPTPPPERVATPSISPDNDRGRPAEIPSPNDGPGEIADPEPTPTAQLAMIPEPTQATAGDSAGTEASAQANKPAWNPAEGTVLQSRIIEMVSTSPDPQAWHRMGDSENLRMESAPAVLRRSLSLEAGTWTIWIRGHCNDENSLILGSLGEQRLRLGEDRPHTTQYQWFRLDNEVELSEAAELELFLSFNIMDPNSRWFLDRIAIADARFASADDFSSANPGSITWLRPPPAQRRAQPQQETRIFEHPGDNDAWEPIPHWDQQYLSNQGTTSPIHRIVASLPYQVGPILAQSISAIQLPRNRFGRWQAVGNGQFIGMGIHARNLSQGSVQLLVNPNRLGGRELELLLFDHRDIPAPVRLRSELNPEQGQAWQLLRFDIPESWADTSAQLATEYPDGLPTHLRVFDPRRITRLAILDPQRTNTFRLYAAAVHINEDPKAEIALPLPPRALIRAQVPLVRELRRREINPDLVRVLYPAHFRTDWQSDLRAGLEAMLGIDRLPNGAVAQLQMHNNALNEEFVKEYLRESQHHVVVVITAGIEFQTGLDRGQALYNFWLTMMREAERSNFLPVVVLGPSRVNEHQRPEADALWDDLLKLIERDGTFARIPVLDLRPARSIHSHRWAPGGRQMSLDLLLGGYNELRLRIHSLLRR
ncbi:MAG: hypothetical protein EA402_12955 [Planctomycetota bacterium]|nr:MAG: hypothetical protein EA402_12955 [Planctomycetota bacterium]